MYTACISPEAAGDIPNFTWNNPKKTFKEANIETIEVDGKPVQILRVFHSHNDHPDAHPSEVTMRVDAMMELLTFAMRTIQATHELTEGYR